MRVLGKETHLVLGSEVLDIALGIILVYLLFSLFATAVREAVES